MIVIVADMGLYLYVSLSLYLSFTLSLYLYFFLRRPRPALVLLLLEATSDQSLLLREFPDRDNVDNDNNTDN